MGFAHLGVLQNSCSSEFLKISPNSSALKHRSHHCSRLSVWGASLCGWLWEVLGCPGQVPAPRNPSVQSHGNLAPDIPERSQTLSTCRHQEITVFYLEGRSHAQLCTVSGNLRQDDSRPTHRRSRSRHSTDSRQFPVPANTDPEERTAMPASPGQDAERVRTVLGRAPAPSPLNRGVGSSRSYQSSPDAAGRPERRTSRAGSASPPLTHLSLHGRKQGVIKMLTGRLTLATFAKCNRGRGDSAPALGVTRSQGSDA